MLLLLGCCMVLTGCTNMTNSIVESFNNNLIAEKRYQMILDGLQVTLLITFLPHCSEQRSAGWSAGCA